MLYYLLYQVLQPYFKPLNVFRYITVRTAYASLTALFLGLLLGPWVIRTLRELQIGQFIREEGPERHQIKAGTPTMGGVLIVIATAVPTLLWADLTSTYVLLALVAMLGFAAIGFADDYSKVMRKHNALARRLLDRQDDYLRFTRDWRIPADNNGSERDIRMIKLRQKVSGCLRTLTGATQFCAIRSYLSTAAKHGKHFLEVLVMLAEGRPWLPAHQ